MTRTNRHAVLSTVLATTTTLCGSPLFAIDRSPDDARGRVGVTDELVYGILGYTSQGLVLEAQLANRLPIFDSGSSSVDSVLHQTRGTGWRLAGSIVGAVRFRMLASHDSAPVRTPSYLPRLDLHAHRTISRIADEHVHRVTTLVVNFVPFGHHSNGQSSCLFVTESRSCLPDGDDPRMAPINRSSGSFSTNFFRLGFFVASRDYTGHGDRMGLLGFGVDLESHPVEYLRLPGGISSALQSEYGKYRLRAHVTAQREILWMDVEMNVTYARAFGVGPRVNSRSVVTDLYVSRPGSRWKLLVRSLAGQDYYNLEYRGTRFWLKAGVAYDFNR